MPSEYDETVRAYNAAKKEYRSLKQAEDRAAARGAPSRGIAPRRLGLAAAETASGPRLYLVSRRGPGCFLVADSTQAYTVTIGERHACTCSAHGQPCAHVHWVLRRCLHLEMATARQPGLAEPALSRAFEAVAAQPIVGRRRPAAGAHAVAPSRPALHGDSVRFLLDLSPEDAWLLRQAPMEAAPAAGGATADEVSEPPSSDASFECRPVEAGDTCAICMEELDPAATSDEGALTWCQPERAGRACGGPQRCGRALHRHCLRVWARHQQQDAPTCPMCRAPWRSDEIRAQSDGARDGARDAAAAEAAAWEATRQRQSALRTGFEQVALREALSEVAHRRRLAEDAALERQAQAMVQRPPPPAATTDHAAASDAPASDARQIARQATSGAAPSTYLVPRWPALRTTISAGDPALPTAPPPARPSSYSRDALCRSRQSATLGPPLTLMASTTAVGAARASAPPPAPPPARIELRGGAALARRTIVPRRLQ